MVFSLPKLAWWFWERGKEAGQFSPYQSQTTHFLHAKDYERNLDSKVGGHQDSSGRYYLTPPFQTWIDFYITNFLFCMCAISKLIVTCELCRND